MDNNEQSSKNEIFVPKKIENKILISYDKKHKKKEKEKVKEADLRNYKVVFIGPTHSGAKTSLINRIIGNQLQENILSTIGVDKFSLKVELKNGKIIHLILWDTPGQYRFRSIALDCVNRADCIILGFSVTNDDELLQIKDFFYSNAKERSNAKLMYLIGNGIDIDKRKVDKKKAKNFANENNLRYFETSCKTGEGIQEFYIDLINEISKI